jgi:hypothetical protein
VVGDGEGTERRYTIASDQLRLGLAEFLMHFGSH